MTNGYPIFSGSQVSQLQTKKNPNGDDDIASKHGGKGNYDITRMEKIENP